MSDEVDVDEVYLGSTPEITAGETRVEGLRIQYLKYGYQIDTLSNLFPILITLDDGRGIDRVKEVVKSALGDQSKFDIRAPGDYEPPPVDNEDTSCHVEFIRISPSTDPELLNEVTGPQCVQVVEEFKEILDEAGNIYRHSVNADDTWYAKFFMELGRSHELQLPYPTTEPVSEGKDFQLQTSIPCYILTEETMVPKQKGGNRQELVTIRWTYPLL
ncbi:hypothetical protein [Haloarchaeobius iranensis]|uniref:Uncharacterized protein n=1 Tax=Haloarchaeobius iranensis TaxID=996166 RepID=A0A1G9XGN5_9EURY|nr:hypothetical protein [Haloarchaeobius iranensis]SDM95979.1 hypothetical protein SAMN05192554_110124 [Haloarchaeobius iranensis]